MSPTKQKIITTAIQLYNTNGVSNVTMRDIAAAVGISPGNLAYHFKNQDFIIEKAFKKMESERNAILMGVQQVPSFENIHRQIPPILQVARRYLFFYLDTVHIIRTYPGIAEMQRSYYENSITYVEAVLKLSQASGNLKEEDRPGAYRRLSQTVWMLMTFWQQQLTLRGKLEQEAEQLQRSIWDLVLPHLTEKGHYQLAKLYNKTEHPSLPETNKTV